MQNGTLMQPKERAIDAHNAEGTGRKAMAKKQAAHSETIHASGTYEKRHEREVRNTRRILIGMLSAVYVIALIAASIAMYTRYQDMVHLAQQGKAVTATVTDRSQSKKHPSDYYVDYSFVVQNREITGYQKVTRSKYDQTHLGGPVTITYLPSDPKLQEWGTVTQESVAATRASSCWAMLFLIVIFAFTMGVIWLCLPRIHKPREVFKT